MEISGLAFHPAELNVAVGDTVVWVNRDIFPHTATASGASGWDTGTLAEGMSGRVVVSDGAELSYRCSLHPTMQGRLIVIR
ncbi:MAG: hypothetical protein IT361_04475 [Gemmatimonadaceae bacterium]|nr:hypothetical protein [Gemmatimonadaceae bacterium]